MSPTMYYQFKQTNSCLNISVCFKYSTHSHTTTPFDAPGKQKPFENTVGNGEIAHHKQFLLFQQCFLPV